MTLLNDIGEALVEQTLSYVADAKSPIDGLGKFKGLSKDYKKLKLEETGSGDANLDLTGSMISSIDYKVIGDKLEIGVYGQDAAKADGHNQFSNGTKSNLPLRRFLPAEGQEYTSQIKNIIDDTIRFYKAENLNVTEKKLSEIETKSELYDFLRLEIGDYSRAKLKQAVLNSELSAMLDDLDMLDLL